MSSHIHKKLRINATEDLISSLPDKLIHHILSFLDAGSALRTCILSKRWKFIWTTLPFLSFDERIKESVFVNLLDHIVHSRNEGSRILNLKLQVKDRGVTSQRLRYYLEYAIKHNVEDLHVEKYSCECDASVFRSYTLKNLSLAGSFRRNFLSSDDCWYLPALTSLHLKQITCHNRDLLGSYINCLPALKNLRLEGFNLINFFSLPGLTNLHLKSCELPETVWDFPALISLELENVEIYSSITEYLSALVSLQSLKFFCTYKNCVICCPQLLFLELRTKNSRYHAFIPSISIFAPKLLSVTIVGVFSITLSDSKLENVCVKLAGFENKDTTPWGTLKLYFRQLMFMFRGLGSAKTLTLDSNTIEALSAIVDLLECTSSPFHDLKYVKLPQGYEDLSICDTVRDYLLGGSPGATIVTNPRQIDVLSQIVPILLGLQNVMQEEPLVTPALELVDPQNVIKKVCTSEICGGLVPNAPESCNYLASSSVESNDLGLWQGHEVNAEFVGLLDLILNKYPQTFEPFTSTDKKLSTMKLNMLCTSIIAFTTIPVTEISTEVITEYRTVFSDLQRSFNLKWLVSHLNNIEQYLFSQRDFHAIRSCADNARRKSQDLSSVGEQKTTKVEESGTNYNSGDGYNGDDLMSDPQGELKATDIHS